MKPSISVIVPVYNTSAYLEKSIQSLINQSFKSFELIVINDGSTDNSLEICEKFAEKDSRIVLISQENKGIGSVRKIGMEKAIGDYIIHVDSDDYVENNFLEELFNQIHVTNADICLCDFNRFSSQTTEYGSQETDLKSDTIINGILTETIFGGLWNKMVKRDLIQQNNLSINSNLKMYEDLNLVIEMLTKTEKISYVNKALYNYRTNEQSITHQRNPETIISAFITVENLSSILDSEKHKNSLNEFKLGVKRDVLLYGDFNKVKNLYPETDIHIKQSTLLTKFQKLVLLLLANKQENLSYAILKLRKKFKSIF